MSSSGCKQLTEDDISVNSYLQILNLKVNVRVESSLKIKLIKKKSDLFVQPRHFVLTKITQ
jgi:hypothetical protein